MEKCHLLGVPTELAFLVFDRLDKNDLTSLRLTCHELNKLVVERLFKRIVVKPTHNLAELTNFRCKTANHVQSIEFFPARPSDLHRPVDEAAYQPPEDLRIPDFPKLIGVHLHGHNLQVRRVAVKLLGEHKFISDLTLNFKQNYFMPTHCERELKGIRYLETLSVRDGRMQETRNISPRLKSRWNPESVTPVWDMITANSDSLRALSLEFTSEHVGNGYVEPSHNPDTSALFPTASGQWEKQLQLRELKLQHLENFGRVYNETEFFNPESLSLVDCPESDAVLLELAGSMKNLKRLPALETLHIALPPRMDFEYKWLAPQKHCVKNLWIEALDSRRKDNDNFEAWAKLEELAFTEFYPASGRRPGVMCLENLKIRIPRYSRTGRRGGEGLGGEAVYDGDGVRG
ncbi:uncharacterized protein DFL_004567 [Arthrobotrys flagrans]|uniref:F-box domain-containing protein n=1 Tax=Arthrobotrys flagrans TaxID=97331 RepID=A0A437A5A9_ARTFL|nr:hypothetical protein DFL_004567 [Arthrobotrys flagrans]